jgi:hypothetical protein
VNFDQCLIDIGLGLGDLAERDWWFVLLVADKGEHEGPPGVRLVTGLLGVSGLRGLRAGQPKMREHTAVSEPGDLSAAGAPEFISPISVAI